MPLTPEGSNGIFYHSAAIVDDRVFVIGGAVSGSGSTQSADSIYVGHIDADGHLGSWTVCPHCLPGKLERLGVAVASNGSLYVIGGRGGASGDITDAVLFTPFSFDFKKSAYPSGSVTYGDTIVYTLRLTNESLRHFETLKITDTIHTGVSTTLQFPDLPSTCTVRMVRPGTDHIVNCEISNLDIGQTKDLNFGVSISQPPSATLPVLCPLPTSSDDVHVEANALAAPLPCNSRTVAPFSTYPVTQSHVSGGSMPLCDADLSLEKDCDYDVVVAGQELTYTLLVHNQGSSTAKDVVVIDDLPDDVAFEQATPQPASTISPLTWHLGAIPAESSREIYLVVQVDPDASDTLTNTARVESSSPDTDSDNDQDEEWTVVVKQADLSMAKTGVSDIVVAGRELTYTLLVDNGGPSTAEDVVVIDRLSDDVTFVRAAPVPVSSASPLTWHLGTIPVRCSQEIQLVVQVDPDASDTLTNTAVVDSGTPDTNPGNNQDEEWTVVVRQADLSVAKIGDPGVVVAGRELTYTLLVRNAGPSPAQDVVVIDHLPDDTMTFVRATPLPVDSTSPLTWYLSTVPPGSSREIQLVARVDPGAPDVLTNTVVVGSGTPDADPDNDQDEEWTAVVREADLDIAKHDDPDPVSPGGTLTYTLVITNQGPSDAEDVSVLDYLPSELDVMTSTLPTVLDHNLLGWEFDLPAGASREIQIVGSVRLTGTGVIRNVAIVSSDIDPFPLNDVTEERTAIGSLADLRIGKVDDPDPVKPGERLTYTLLITNAGPSAATGVVVTDTLPAGVCHWDPLPFNCDYNHDPAMSDRVVCRLGTMLVGEQDGVRIWGTVCPSATEALLNSVEVSSDAPDSIPENNLTDEITSIYPPADLRLEKSHYPSLVVAGKWLTYTLRVSNLGPSDASNVVVSDSLPSGVEFVSATAPATAHSGVVEWYTPTLSSGASWELELVVRVTPSITGSLTNVATAHSSTSDNDPANNQARDWAKVHTVADLSITKTGWPDAVNHGELLTYTLLVTNAGPSDAYGVTVLDYVPPTLAVLATTPSTVGGSDPLEWNLGHLHSGETVKIRIVTTVISGGVGTIRNVAMVLGDNDYNPLNDADDVRTAVGNVADLRIEKSHYACCPHCSDVVIAGDLLTYTILVSNAGPSDAVGVIVRDTLAPGTSFVAADPFATEHAGVVTWYVPTLPSGASWEFELLVQVDPGITGTLVNTAVVTSGTPDSYSANDHAQDEVIAYPLADLGIRKTDNQDLVNHTGALTYTLMVTNSGPSDAYGVTVLDYVPSTVEVIATEPPTASGSDPLEWKLEHLPAGECTEIQVVATVTSDGAQQIRNVAMVLSNIDLNPGNDVDDDWTAVGSLADLRIEKSHETRDYYGHDVVIAGELLTYMLEVSNGGPSIAWEVLVTDTLPAGTYLVTADPPAVEHGGVVTWHKPVLLSNHDWDIELVVRVGSDVTTTLVNTAIVASSTPDNNPADNRVQDQTVAYAMADLCIGKIGVPKPVDPGRTLTYTLVVTNRGPSDARDVTVIDLLPLELVSITTTIPVTTDSNRLEWHLGYLTATHHRTIQVMAMVRLTSTGTIHNVALVSNEIDPDPSDNIAEDRTAVGNLADLHIAKIAYPYLVIPGEMLTYTLVVTNDGPSDATGVVVTDVLPPEVCRLDCLSPNCCGDPSVCNSDTVVCDLGTVSAGESEKAQIRTTVCPTSAGAIVNTATVTSTVPDITSADDTTTTRTYVHETELGIRMNGESGPVTGGDVITYTLEITNSGPFYGRDVRVEDVLPRYTSYVASSAEPEMKKGNVVTWYTPTLQVGAKWTIVVTVRISSQASGLLSNVANVTSSSSDLDSSNNCDGMWTMAPVPIINVAYVGEGNLWSKKSNPVINSPHKIYLPIVIKDLER